MRIFGLGRNAIQFVWMALVFIVVIMILKDSTELITAPLSMSGQNSVGRQQIESLQEVVMMENLPSSKWVVLDGLTTNCYNVTAFTHNFEWRVVLVISKREHHIVGCNFPRCTMITAENHESLLGEMSLTQVLKRPTKLSGYLYAIGQGAEIILDSGCNDPVSISSLEFLSTNRNQNSEQLLYNDSTVFNPFEHFGYASHYSNTLLALRDFKELSNDDYNVKSKNRTNSEMFYLQQMMEVVPIQQWVSKCHASYCDKNIFHGNDSVQFSTPPVSVGVKTIGVLDSGPTIFHRKAFLWLFLPVHLPEHSHSIFRDLFIHGIRSFTNTPITYFPVKNEYVCECRTGFNESLKLNQSKLKEFINWFDNATCRKSKEIVHCMIDLLRKVMGVMEGKIVSIKKRGTKTRALLMAWLDDLASLGLEDVFLDNEIDRYNSYSYDSGDVKIKYAFQRDIWKSLSSQQMDQIQTGVFTKMHSVCSGLSPVHPPVGIAQWKNPLMEDVMLIIVINYESIFKSSPYLEYLHRYFFKYIAYCGPGVEHFRDYAEEHGFTYITYINGIERGWKYMYDCTTYAMKLGLPVKGYLQIGDDTLIHTRKFINLPRDQIWMPGGYDKKNLYTTKTLEYWGHWSREYGRPALINVFNELHNVSMTENTTTIISGDKNITVSPQYRSFSRRFLQTYNNNIGLDNAVHRAVDIYYIPQVLKSDFIMASELFRRHGSIVEMAIPTIHLGLAPKNKIKYLRGVSLWRKDREKPWIFYDVKTMHFMHPFKSLVHLNQTEGQLFFCKTFLPDLFHYNFVSKR